MSISVETLVETEFISVEDSLAGQAVSPIKHENVAGEVFPMTGAGEAHSSLPATR